MLYTARFMTITCNVRPEWRGRIPAVVHIDGTARPQVVTRDRNPLYYDILKAYEKQTGIPVLINTSFNDLMKNPSSIRPGNAPLP